MLCRKSQLFLRKIFFNEPQRAQRAPRKRMERTEDVKKWLKFVRCEIFY